ncbi:DUF6538 domain-containing protein [Tardiphaga sp.]|jgi:integrase|uniref:DUF6538 domain-containing protein n=1 Tax=Tardiphaga sp. TaxID=1926292 RepID=UPI0037D9C97A
MGNSALPQPVRKFHRKKGRKPIQKSELYWLRKRVPDRYRKLLGKQEVWRSLDTTDLKTARTRCVILSDQLDREWAARLAAAEDAGRLPKATTFTRFELSGLQRLVHAQTRDAFVENAGRFVWGAELGTRSEDEDLEAREYDEADMDAFLERNGFVATEEDRRRFLPLFLQARKEGYRDLRRAAGEEQDFSESPKFKNYAPSPKPQTDFLEAFEFYCTHAEVKGGITGPTARRWRPKIKEFCGFVGHTDLARMTTDDGYRWMDHLVGERAIVRKSVRDVWIASIKAVAGFMVERRKLDRNPFLGIRVRKVKAGGTMESNQKGFSDAQAATILTATLAEFSRLTTRETRATRRWVPWTCAYTGARVNEVTSLLPSDIRKDPETGIVCFYLRPEMTKGDYRRVVPVHSHLIEQGLLDYVEERRRLSLPLFYDPSRAEGDTIAHPQFQKVGQRLGEWVVRSLGITGVKPNHAWRHRFKSVARDVGMHPEVEAFITGHGGSDDQKAIDKVSLNYGDPWVKTLKKAIELHPRYAIAALERPPQPLKKTRRSPGEMAAARKTKAAANSRVDVAASGGADR